MKILSIGELVNNKDFSVFSREDGSLFLQHLPTKVSLQTIWMNNVLAVDISKAYAEAEVNSVDMVFAVNVMNL